MPTATATKPTSTRKPKAQTAKATEAPAAPAPDTSALEKEAILALKAVIDLDTKRTAALKKLAHVICQLRRKLDDPAGTSQAYRDAAERIYKGVNIPADSSSGIQASIRYHIGNVLREEFTSEELAAVGLSDKTPLERAREARAAGTNPGGVTAQTQTEAERKAEQAVVHPGEVTNGDGIPITSASVEVLPDSVVLASTNPPQVGRRKEKRDYTERPRAQIALPPNPVILIGHALDIVRAAVSIKDIPTTDLASLRDMARRLHEELNHLEARLGKPEAPKAASGQRTSASKSATKAA